MTMASRCGTSSSSHSPAWLRARIACTAWYQAAIVAGSRPLLAVEPRCEPRSAAHGDADVAGFLVDDQETPIGPHGQPLGGLDAGDQGTDHPRRQGDGAHRPAAVVRHIGNAVADDDVIGGR